MDKEVKVKGGERNKGELMGGNLKRGILVGKRGGNSTPSPTWKFQDFNFGTTTSRNIHSARKLGANLWEMQPQINLRVEKMSQNGANLSHQNQDHIFDAQAQSPSKQQTSDINSRKQLEASLMQHDLRVKKAGLAQQPLSSASYCSSMEMAPYRPAITPNSSFVSKGKFGESSHSLKTSTELLKVLNRIWSLEEKHALDMSLVKTLKNELGQSQTQIQELLQEKKSDQNEIDNLTKQITELKVVRKKEQDRIKDAVKLVDEKLENELKLRRNSEKHHHKLAKELSEMKSSFSNALKELERERKARTLLEDLCDEFAKGIRDYEQEVRFLKQKSSMDQIGREGNDRFILHISEAWLDERTQMKLADMQDIYEKRSPLDKLCLEIEAFLQEKQSGKNYEKNDYMSPKNPCEISRSLETFHLNEPASAPWKADEEDDSVSMRQGHFGNNLNSDGRYKKTARPKEANKKVRSRKNSDPSSSHVQLDDEELTKSRTDELYETNTTKMPRKYDTVQRSSSDYMFIGPSSPVKKWTSKVITADPEISESSSRWQKSVKSNTLKAKLIEARLEGQLSRARTSRSLSRVD